MSNTKPDFLKPGDYIYIVAPAKRVEQEPIEAFASYCQKRGYRVKFSEHLFDRCSFFSSSDENRTSDLQQALNDSESKAIFCARGGYGTSRIIDHLDFSVLLNIPKWVIGFSDITFLLNAIDKLGVCSIHGPVPGLFDVHNSRILNSFDFLFQYLEGQRFNYHWHAKGKHLEGSATGEIIGGNLSILCSQLGTPTETCFHNKILFVEEVDEFLYSIDRMFVQLKRSGRLAGLAGVIIGHFSKIKDTHPSFGMYMQDIVVQTFREYGIPVAFGFPAGHEDNHISIPFGVNIELNVSNSGVELKELK